MALDRRSFFKLLNISAAAAPVLTQELIPAKTLEVPPVPPPAIPPPQPICPVALHSLGMGDFVPSSFIVPQIPMPGSLFKRDPELQYPRGGFGSRRPY